MSEPLDYADGETAAVPRLSRMAVMALPAGLLSFPLLVHWTTGGALESWAKSLGVGANTLTEGVAYAWPIGGIAFCLLALARVALSRGRLRGLAWATSGFALACAWLLIWIAFRASYRSAPGSW